MEFIKFWKSKNLEGLRENFQYVPNYGFHLGVICIDCGKDGGWIKQDDRILKTRFYSPMTEGRDEKENLTLDI